MIRWLSRRTHCGLRFTDFLVFEIDKKDRTVHLKSLEPPAPSSTPAPPNDAPLQDSTAPTPPPELTPAPEVAVDVPVSIPEVQAGYIWSEDFAPVLEKFLSPLAMDKLKQMYEEGPEPPFVSDSGWGGRQAKQGEPEVSEEPPAEKTTSRGRGGGRGGRGRDRGAPARAKGDNRRVFTEVCTFSLLIHITERAFSLLQIKPCARNFIRLSGNCSRGTLTVKPTPHPRMATMMGHGSP